MGRLEACSGHIRQLFYANTTTAVVVGFAGPYIFSVVSDVFAFARQDFILCRESFNRRR